MNLVKRLEHEQTKGLGTGNIWPMAKSTPPQSEVDQIAARLKIGRTALGLSPADLCRLTKIRPNTYSQWENAKGRPRLDEAKLLRKHLGYTLDWIYEGDSSGLPHKLAAKIAELEPPRPSRTGAASAKGKAA